VINNIASFMGRHKNPDFIHHQNTLDTSVIREAVFGMEDGMVSTFGAVTGIAASTGDPFTVILAGSVIIAVESISMGVGSYLSSKSQKEMDERKLTEESHELHEYPHEEKEELIEMYVREGWPKKLSREMAEVASQDKKLFLKEMAIHELKVFPDHFESPIKNAVAMLFAYIVGGLIPLLPYLLLPIPNAIPVSVVASLIGLFFLGVGTTRYSKRSWWRAGLEMLTLAALAGAIGYFVGQLVEKFV
jgi:VIT1/CCC1 family predicted Fe2+/Mn2+ transporter